MNENPLNLESIILQWKLGSKEAEHQLYQLAYAHLHRLSKQERARNVHKHGCDSPVFWDGTCNTTALVHDAYLKLSQSDTTLIENTRDFMLLIVKIMRQILIDNARHHCAQKRQKAIENHEQQKRSFEQLIVMDKAIDSFSASYPRQSNALKLRYFGGMKNQEISQVLGCSTSLVEKDLKFSRFWLTQKLNPTQKHNGL
ncbi:ECF-type sigma factor [Vibrio maerlii]|uniref:ECF-type sigma factor n=1 Tax=Vibrio maerlii TaxID=2231648 RepID=UPI000E3C662A|nr:ECF-type sigma factor [Vibrio maerlii]